MTTDYTTALAIVGLVTVVLTAMTAFVLSRPSDLPPTPQR
jgi:hypothetical protein